MTVAELIEWLRLQPDQQATVRVVRRVQSRRASAPDEIQVDDFRPELSEYVDHRENEFSRGKPWEQDHYLLLGER